MFCVLTFDDMITLKMHFPDPKYSLYKKAPHLQEPPPPQQSDGEEELDLLYDPVLNCYYDPKSCKYYELVWLDY